MLLKEVLSGDNEGDEGDEEWTDGLQLDEDSLQLSEKTEIDVRGGVPTKVAVPLPSPEDVDDGLQAASIGEFWSLGERKTFPAEPMD